MHQLAEEFMVYWLGDKTAWRISWVVRYQSLEFHKQLRHSIVQLRSMILREVWIILCSST